ncbi:MAG: methyltransferase domain-containing protein [bacterium]
MFTDPLKNIKSLGLRETDIVADLGAGTGFYSVAAGHIVSKGKVYAVEINKDYLATIKQKVRDAHVSNVEIIWGDIEKKGGTSLRDGIIDVAIASNVLFQVQDKDKFIQEIFRILKKGGKVLLIDWTETSLMAGQSIVSKKNALALFEKHGFVLDVEVNAGLHHYGMILIKK